MAKRKTRKCAECKKTCETDKMYLVESFCKRKGEMVIEQKYYCDERCSKGKQEREDIKKMITEILDMPIYGNSYFDKLYRPLKDHYGYRVIYDMLSNEYWNLVDALNKNFMTSNIKIKYFMTIIQSRIEEYKYVEENNKIEDFYTPEYEDIVIKEQVVKKKKSIFDM